MKRLRHSFDCSLSSHEEKEALQARLESLRRKLYPGGRTIDNTALINAAAEEKLAASSQYTPTLDQGSVRPFHRECTVLAIC